MVETNESSLTEDEADLYDRQIRLWGLESQKRLRASTVLLIGMKGLGAEFCKNIVLAGIKTITLMDCTDSTKEDIYSQFLIPREQIGTNRAIASMERAQRLNPMVEILVDKENLDNKPDDFFTHFSAVVATDCNIKQLLRINNICHKVNVKFFCSEVFGFFGYMFTDLRTHVCVDEVVRATNILGKKNCKKVKLEDIRMVPRTVQETLNYCTLEESLLFSQQLINKPARVLADLVPLFLLKILFKFRADVGRNPGSATREKDLELLKKYRSVGPENFIAGADKVPDEYLSSVFSQVSPVCAIVGGELAQEVIKTLSQRGVPHNNFFFFNPIKGHGIVVKVRD